MALKPIRWLMSQLVYPPGSGPDRETSKQHYVEWRALGLPDSQSSQKAFASLRFTGSAYRLTGITLSEGAGTILYGENTMAHQIGGGVLTPATLGQQYLDRLEKAGLKLDLKMLNE